MRLLKTFEEHTYSSDISTIINNTIDSLKMLVDFGFELNSNNLKEKINQILNQSWKEADLDTKRILETQRIEIVNQVIEKFSNQ